MLSKVSKAAPVAIAVGIFAAAIGAQGSRAAAQDLVIPAVLPHIELQPAPAAPSAPASAAAPAPATSAAGSLTELVAAQAQDDELPRELKCLAGAIYFEAKGETLPGQLAVGRVIVNRSKSGRFPDSYCGVVYQHAQFSFVHGAGMPTIRRGSRGWREAVAIARIADAGSWKSETEGALYFHAARVAPHWRMTKIARVDDHVFYR